MRFTLQQELLQYTHTHTCSLPHNLYIVFPSTTATKGYLLKMLLWLIFLPVLDMDELWRICFMNYLPPWICGGNHFPVLLDTAVLRDHVIPLKFSVLHYLKGKLELGFGHVLTLDMTSTQQPECRFTQVGG